MEQKKKIIAIIGAGAAGCFAAINLKRFCPEADITVYEGGRKPLAKVAITGGGRCNLTNSFCGIKSTDEAYPRGGRLMKRLLKSRKQLSLKSLSLKRKRLILISLKVDWILRSLKRKSSQVHYLSTSFKQSYRQQQQRLLKKLKNTNHLSSI